MSVEAVVIMMAARLLLPKRLEPFICGLKPGFEVMF